MLLFPITKYIKTKGQANDFDRLLQLSIALKVKLLVNKYVLYNGPVINKALEAGSAMHALCNISCNQEICLNRSLSAKNDYVNN